MPIYAYYCNSCKRPFEVMHGMFYELERCNLCSVEGELEKIPNMIQKPPKEATEKKIGSEVKKFIEDSKKELKQEKKRLKSEQL